MLPAMQCCKKEDRPSHSSQSKSLSSLPLPGSPPPPISSWWLSNVVVISSVALCLKTFFKWQENVLLQRSATRVNTKSFSVGVPLVQFLSTWVGHVPEYIALCWISFLENLSFFVSHLQTSNTDLSTWKFFLSAPAVSSTVCTLFKKMERKTSSDFREWKKYTSQN